jgi:hypothetical protein
MSMSYGYGPAGNIKGSVKNESRSMTVPQPFQYQGSKRALAPLILQYLPISTTRLVEPFCGSAAGSCSAAVPGCGFGHRPGARFCNWRRGQNSRRDAAVTRRRGRLRYE